MEVSRSADDDISATNNGNFWNDLPETDTINAILSLGNAPAKERSSHSGSSATLGGNGNPGDPASVPGQALSPQGPEGGVAFEDLCPVCGDRVSGYHYGLQTCESCKGFFKRTVQNGKVYLCIEKQQCVVTKAQRKRCPYCRFQKCLSVGMKLEAVRADRMRGGRNKFGPLYKYDRAVKQQALQHRQHMLSNRLFSSGGASDTYDSGMEMPPMPSATPPDVKPDINLLSSYVASDCSQPNHGHFMSQMARSILPHAKPFGKDVLESSPGGPCQLTVPHYQTAGSSPHASYAPSGLQMCFPGATRPGHPMTSGPINATNPLAGMVHMMSEIDSSLSPPVPSPNAFHFQGHHYSQQQQQQLQHPHESPWPQQPHPASLQLPAQYRNDDAYSNTVYSGYGARWYDPTSCLPSSGVSTSTHPSPSTTSSFCTPPRQPFASPTIPLRSTVPSFMTIPPLIKELQRNELSKSDILQKLGTLVDSLLTQYSSLRSEITGATQAGGGDSSVSGSCLRSMLQIFCQLCDRSLFMLVEWARGAHLFKELKVDCQMRLLQGSWSELLIFNIVYQQTRHQRLDELLMATGHTVSIGLLLKLGLQVVVQHLTELIRKVRELALDPNEYSCLKFIILLNPDISGLSCRELVEQLQERVNTALLEYCSVIENRANDRFGQLLMLLHDVRLVSLHGEDFFYAQHLNGNILENTLLVEMLHSRQA